MQQDWSACCKRAAGTALVSSARFAQVLLRRQRSDGAVRYRRGDLAEFLDADVAYGRIRNSRVIRSGAARS